MIYFLATYKRHIDICKKRIGFVNIIIGGVVSGTERAKA